MRWVRCGENCRCRNIVDDWIGRETLAFHLSITCTAREQHLYGSRAVQVSFKGYSCRRLFPLLTVLSLFRFGNIFHSLVKPSAVSVPNAPRTVCFRFLKVKFQRNRLCVSELLRNFFPAFNRRERCGETLCFTVRGLWSDVYIPGEGVTEDSRNFVPNGVWGCETSFTSFGCGVVCCDV